MPHLVIAVSRDGTVQTAVAPCHPQVAALQHQSIWPVLSPGGAAAFQASMQKAEQERQPQPLDWALLVQGRQLLLTGSLHWSCDNLWIWVGGEADELHARLDEWEAAHNLAPLGFHLLDKEGRFLRVNQCECAWFGLSRDQLLGTLFSDLIDPADRQKFCDAAAAGPIGQLELALLPLAESTRHVALSSSPHYGADGALLFSHCALIDITQRIQAEQRVERGEALLQAFMENHPAPAFIKDQSGRYLYVNSSLQKVLRRPRQEIIGTTSEDYLDAEQSARVRALDQLVLSTGQPHTLSFSEMQGDVGGHWLAFRFPVVDEDGTTLLGGISLDITERVEAERALRESNQFVQAVADQLTAHLFIFDVSTARPIYFNPAAVEFYGMSVADFQTREPGYIFQFAHPDHGRLLHTYMARMRQIQPGERLEGEIRMRDVSGIYHWLGFTQTALTYDDSGRVMQVLGVAQDITERKRLQAQLEEARDVALESVRIKSEFLATMSHEIRTPMNGVIGLTELLLQSDLDAEQQSWASGISESAASLLTIINDILDFSKIEAGKLVFESIEFDPGRLVEEVSSQMRNRASAKAIELGSLIEADVPTAVKGDPGRLRQVLLNLVSNAVKFTENGHILIRVQLESSDEQSCLLSFSVRDTGLGIPEDAQQKLFQPFTQADSSTTRQFGGTGLGLAICRQLVSLMGGEIGVQSQTGQGSTFSFTARFAHASHAPSSAAGRDDLRGLRLLVVDGNEVSRHMLASQTTAWHMPTAQAENSSQAIHYLQDSLRNGQPPEVVLLDAHRLDTDVNELAWRLQHLPGFDQLRIVVLSNHAVPVVPTLARTARLTRPVRQSQLYDCLASLVNDVPWSPSPPRERPAAPTPGAGPLQGHVLLAEDNSVNTKVATAHLRRLGCTVHAVSDGLQAIQALSDHRFQLVLMDCQMPRMDGLAATRAIREQERQQGAPHIPVIALTANAMQGDRDLCLAAGMDDYISKPINFDQLREVLQRWLPQA